jgi:PHS family inorganic phosphate transporter-like MFS transporter
MISAQRIESSEERVTFRKTLARIILSGVGFFSDSYDLFVINIVLIILETTMSLTSFHKAIISASVLIGTIIGQLGFGILGDFFGRQTPFIVTLSIIIVGAILSSASPPIPATNHLVIISLCIFRLILGIGIGGEYPLASTITSESSTPQNRGRLIALVFSMQGIGFLTASLVGMIILRISGHLELDWRLCFGLGAIPPLMILFLRVFATETPVYIQHQNDKVKIWTQVRKYWKRLLGTAGSWFLIDIVFYGNGLLSSTILSVFGIGNHESDVHHKLIAIATFQVYLSLISLPGYWTAIYLIEHPWFGRRNLQLLGFGTLGSLYFIIAGVYPYITSLPWLFLILYGLTFFLINAGANTTTFVLPAEVYPTRVRATFHGISAASGKLGVAVGSYAIAYITKNPRLIFYLCGGVAGVGLILTWFLVEETRGKDLEEDIDLTETPTSPVSPVSPVRTTVNPA